MKTPKFITSWVYAQIQFISSARLKSLLASLMILFFVFFIFSGRVLAANVPVESLSKMENPARLVSMLNKVEQRIATLQQQEENEEQQAELTLLRQVLQFVKKRKAAIIIAAQFEQQTKSAPKRIAVIKEELSQPLPELQLQIKKGMTLDELRKRLSAAKVQRDIERKVRADVEQLTTDNTNRRHDIPAEVADTRLKLTEVKKNILSDFDSNNASDLDKARSFVLRAEKIFLDEKLISLEREARNFETERDLTRARKQLIERKVLFFEKKVEIFENFVTAIRSNKAEQARLNAEKQQRIAAKNAHPIIQNIAGQNESLAAELIRISEKSAQMQKHLQTVKNASEKLSKDFVSVQEKLSEEGFNDSFGIRLRKLRINFPDLARHTRALTARNNELNNVQLRRIELEDVLLATVDMSKKIDRLFSDYPDLEFAENSVLRKNIQHAMLEQKNQYLLPLIEAYDVYFDDILEPLHENERQLIATGERFSAFISEFILWVQSTHPIKIKDFVHIGNALYWFVDPNSWLVLLDKIEKDIVSDLFFSVVFIFVIVLLLSQQRRMYRVLNDMGMQAKKKFKARFRHTLIAALVTFILAGIWPFVLWLISYQLNGLDDLEFTAAIAEGLQRVALLLFVGHILLIIVKQNGLAEAHFHWPQANINLIKRHVRWLLPAVIPFGFVISVLEYQSIEAHRDSLGRFAFMTVMFIVAVFLYRLMHPRTGVFADMLVTHRNGWLDKLHVIWFPCAVLAPVIFSIMAGWGYMYTAIKLEQEFVITVMLIIGILMSRDFIMRWLELAQRRMALEQARKKFAARVKAREKAFAETGELGEEKTSITADIAFDEQLIDVDAVSAQSKKLVQSLFFFLLVIGIFFIWTDVLPAFGLLNEVELWQQTVSVSVEQLSGKAAGSDGIVQQIVSVTLGDIIIALFFVVATLIVSRNIPGLMEMVILRHLPFSPGGRYAATTLTRYAIVIVGVLLAFEAIGVGWSKVQWLAAAVTVGLGFGLQEIFANFVSGLIILFERPIRVGDAVTVGNISGRVTRIQMRATTITDWDRKELIIPNKEFVTGQVVNWSLTDTIVRIPIEVGIAYGSDTKLATKLLLDIARSNNEVLSDPEPTAYFIGFADSTLNFSLRVFVQESDEVYPVRHEILTCIDEVFHEQGIEIAFPQRDLHIRSVDAECVQNVTGKGQSLKTKMPLGKKP